MKNIIYITITCLFISVTNLFAVDLTGEYSAKGTTPGPENAKNYKGTASIKKTGESYHITWNVGVIYEGTGILKESILSVVYTTNGGKTVGVAAYNVSDTGSILEGEWCGIMGENLGTEVLTKVKAVE